MLKLKGLRILNTRPKQQASLLSNAIFEAGGVSIELPTLEIKESSNNWIDSLPRLELIQQAIFISANAVNYFFTKLSQDKVIWPPNIQITAMGQGTAKALQSFDLSAHHVPEVADSEHILALDHLQNIQHLPILLIKGQGGLGLIDENLRFRGADLHTIEVYYRALPLKNEEYTYSLWHDDRVDIIIFTSQQTMLNLFELLGANAHSWIIDKPCLVISQRLAMTAASLGIKNINTCHYNDILTTLEGFKHDYQP